MVPTLTFTKKSQSSTWNAMSFTASPCFIKWRPISAGGEEPETAWAEATASRPGPQSPAGERTFVSGV